MRTSSEPGPVTVERYYEMADCGLIAPDDRVELLEGLLIAMPPPSPPHDTAVHAVQMLLLRRLGLDVVVRSQSTFQAGRHSAPQPDVLVLPGRNSDYRRKAPTRAHLVVEIAQSSLIQDRMTKAEIYARAEVPCYWLVNLRDRCVEVFRGPDRWKGIYTDVTRAAGSDPLSIDAFPGIAFAAEELLPPDDPDEA